MRVAVAGKGGAGKTTISATLARLRARSGARVVAVDADSNPNLAMALGVDREVAAALRPIPPRLVSRRLGGPGLVEPLEQILAQYTAPAPDGVRLGLMGMPAHADEGCLCSAHATVSALLGDLGTDDVLTVVDMEASPEHLSRGTARNVDTLLLVTEAYYRSLETVKRLAALASELPITRVAVVANKLRSASDEELIAEFCERHGLELAAAVPFNGAVIDADVRAVPLIEAAPDSPTVAAIAELDKHLRAWEPAER